jgi:vacuolar-type H+-ATPase subunit F/Vma7
MRVIVIGDEASALGFRLAGVEMHVPAAADVSEELRAARAQADLVLITAPLAGRLSVAELDAALHALEPLVLVIPDLRHLAEPPDVAAEVSRALGVRI